MFPSADTSVHTGKDSGDPGPKSKSKDSREAATSRTDPASPIPENILAFRTLTSMLSKIQQEMPFTVLDSKEDNIPKAEQYQLRLLNAFSVIAVIDHQVIAAVLKRNQSVERQEVILSVSSSLGRVRLTQKPQLPSQIIKDIYDTITLQLSLFVARINFAQNPQKDDKNAASKTNFSIPPPPAPDTARCDLDSNASILLYVRKSWPLE